jgi:isopenicillin-N epimerase
MPGFGRHRLPDWRLAPKVAYLNHGTVGATPRRVLARQDKLRKKMERAPSAFLLREVVPMVGASAGEPGKLRAAAAEVAAFVGAPAGELALVTNVTAGINAALRSLRFSPGDEILMLDHCYGAIANAARAIAGPLGATLIIATLPVPVTDPAEVIAAVEAALTPRTRLAILDHITASSALVLPIAELTRRCQARGVTVIVDGAHAPGAIPLDVAAIGADFYAANLHKWAWAPRSCGFLHARPERHAGLHGAIVSWGMDAGMLAEFEWPGTFDPTPMLAAVEGPGDAARRGRGRGADLRSRARAARPGPPGRRAGRDRARAGDHGRHDGRGGAAGAVRPRRRGQRAAPRSPVPRPSRRGQPGGPR